MTEPGAPLAPAQPAPRRLRRPALVASAYLVLSTVLFARAWIGGPTHTLQFDGGDQFTYIWHLRWMEHALTHGHNPFFTEWLNAPDGVNLLNNTAPLLLALVATPLTMLFGPVLAYNVLQTLGVAAGAAAMYYLLRRWSLWWPAAFLGGLAYGFSPYVIAAGWGHLPLMFVALPPLIVVCMDEILVRQRGSRWRWGTALGLLVVAQYFSSSELLANTAEVCILGTIYLAVRYRDRVRAHLSYATSALLTAVGVAGALLAYPLWFMLFGPQSVRISGVPTTLFSGDVAGPVVPTSNQLFSPEQWSNLGDRLDGYAVEYMGRTYAATARGYLGVPLLLFALAVVIRYRRDARVQLLAVISAVMYVAYLGPVLKVWGHITDIPMPAKALTQVPLLETTSPDRYSLFVLMGVVALFATGIDRMRAHVRPQWLAAIVVACLLPLIPAAPYSMMQVREPAEWFRTEVKEAVPQGSVLLSYPFPGPSATQPMEWQASADLHYRIVGGYQYVPDRSGGWTLNAGKGPTQELLTALHRGNRVGSLSASQLEVVRGELRRWQVDTVVVAMSEPQAQEAVEAFTSVLGRSPTREHGVAVWYDLPFGGSSP